MKKKKALIIAVSLIILGCILCTAVFILNDNRLPSGKVGVISLGDGDFIKKTKVIEDKFTSIEISDISSMDISICKSKDNTCYVEYYDTDEIIHNIGVNGDTLSINSDGGGGYFNFSFTTLSPVTTVYLPDSEYSKIRIETSSGDVEVDNTMTVDELIIEASSGSIFVNNISGAYAGLTASSGDISLNNITADTISFKTSSGSTNGYNVVGDSAITGSAKSGDIEIEGTSSLYYELKTSSGDIELELNPDNQYVFETRTGSGDIEVPASVPGANAICNLKSESGDIEVN